jgi:hypothetical protein
MAYSLEQILGVFGSMEFLNSLPNYFHTELFSSPFGSPI